MASHKMKRQRGRYRRDSGEDETREKEGARNQSDKRGTDREAGLLQGRGQLECKNQSVAQKNKKCTKYKTLVHVPNSKSVRLSREEQANDSLE